jgi:multiple sugar transport system permease protein
MVANTVLRRRGLGGHFNPHLKRRFNRHVLNNTLVFIFLCVLSFVMIGIPLGWVVTASLKSKAEIFAYPPVYIPQNPQWQNYSQLFSDFPFARFILNSLFIATINIIGQVFSCSLVAFSFARLRFPGKNILFIMLLSTLMLPGQVLIIPTFALFNRIGWVDTYLPLTVPSFFGSAFFIFLMRQYILTIPRELDEAARIDGASTLKIFWHIILPLARPPLILIIVTTFLSSWNDFLGPLLYLSEYDSYTIQLGLNMLKGRYNIEWHLIMAGAVIAILPCLVLFFITQRYLIGGIANVGIKG